MYYHYFLLNGTNNFKYSQVGCLVHIFIQRELIYLECSFAIFVPSLYNAPIIKFNLNKSHIQVCNLITGDRYTRESNMKCPLIQRLVSFRFQTSVHLEANKFKNQIKNLE